MQREDPLDAARGIFNGMVLGALLWGVVLLIVFAIRGHAATTPAPGFAVAVWDPPCIVSIEKTQRTRIEAPVSSAGAPDLRRAVISGIVTHIRPNCERLEIRRAKP